MKGISEKEFEEAVEESLVSDGNYISRKSSNYDKELCLDSELLIEFIRRTQLQEWKKLESLLGSSTEQRFLKTVHDHIKNRGVIEVLRKGIRGFGLRFDLIYFKPESSLNETHQYQYTENIFSVIRQLHFSSENPELSVDLTLFINGIPIITSELKNPLTGQTVENAIKQYQERNPNDLLFKHGRCVAHFAVDPHLVYMTTKLDKDKTSFLPFNKGFNRGAGNPPSKDPNMYDTTYLWEDIWAKDTLLEIIENYLQDVDEKKNDKKIRKVIFPRYHQFDAVQTIIGHLKHNGSGHKYLIQHSAGSGKSNTISWLCNKLCGLHDSNNKRIFDAIFVITDRRILDQQLSKNLRQFEKVKGTVEWIEYSKAKSLAQAIEEGKEIIVTTLQTFPFVVDFTQKVKGKKFAIVIDEAHSSQSGDAAKDLKTNIVSKNGIEFEDEQVKDAEDTINEEVEGIIGQMKGSYFAFTATPKNKTLELFGEEQPDGTFEPFHLYSMKQAIEERFILDVLQNYVTYSTYFELIKSSKDDPKYKKTVASALIKNYVGSSSHAIRKKTKVMLNHFWTLTSNRIKGRAKAMVVTSSRATAVKYYLEFKKQIEDARYPFEALVAFSGAVKGEDVDKVYKGDEFTEPKLNGFPERKTAEYFKEDKYRILIVANKFQTGFDEPLLHTMYVDKKLGGVGAVQTLSRLNRVLYPDKVDTMVLDFVNDEEQIREAFEPYYVKTTLSGATDPNKLYDYMFRLEKFNIYAEEDVENFSKEYFSKKGKHVKIYYALQPAIQRWNNLDLEDKKEFKKLMRSFVRLYAFLSQIIPFSDIELEKLYQYSRFLVLELELPHERLPVEITEKINLSSYKLQVNSKGENGIVLSGNEGVLKPISPLGELKDQEDELSPLSLIIKDINEHFGGTKFTDEDKIEGAINDMENHMINNEKLIRAVNSRTNSRENLEIIFKEFFEEELDKLFDVNLEVYSSINNNDELADKIKQYLFDRVYRRFMQGRRD